MSAPDDVMTGGDGDMKVRFKRVFVALIAFALLVPAVGDTGDTTHAGATAWCGGSQGWQTVRSSLGLPIRIKARVASVAFASAERGRPTFINLGRPYPNRSRVTLVIWGRDRVNFPRPPERMFKPGQIVCAQGVATMYAGAPQIEVGLWDAKSRLLSF
jgi:hypothetical protein